MKKDLLKMDDLSREEILEVLNIADQLKYELKHNIPHKHLEGKSIGMIFNKKSTRTRVSFEVGMYQLGGYALFLNKKDLQTERGETAEDTARALSRFINGIMVRTYSQKEIEILAEYATIPIINGLTDEEHPCQVLADLMTIREYKNILEGLKVCYIGDGNNMANSLIVGTLKVGMNLSIACPPQYMPSKSYIERGKELATLENSEFNVFTDPKEAIRNADVVITDAWCSMGHEDEAEKRLKIFAPYQVNKELMEFAKDDAIVLHCLPANREKEITKEILDKHSNEIFDESENRLHVEKAILVKLIKNM
ncbi:MAG: ornithine carbamoyltransferase [Clostridium sp.]|nr:ornithine carbamoyltransferase [Clostridium sp.]